MAITVEAIYENGVLKPDTPLPLNEHDRVQIIVSPSQAARPRPTPEEAHEIVSLGYGLMGWKGTHEELEQLLREAEEPEELP